MSWSSLWDFNCLRFKGSHHQSFPKFDSKWRQKILCRWVRDLTEDNNEARKEEDTLDWCLGVLSTDTLSMVNARITILSLFEKSKTYVNTDKGIPIGATFMTLFRERKKRNHSLIKSNFKRFTNTLQREWSTFPTCLERIVLRHGNGKEGKKLIWQSSQPHNKVSE